MHPACAICQGACCESITVPVETPAQRDYARVRGTLELAIGGEQMRVHSVCPQLTAAGCCGIWATRPGICEAYPVGGSGCRAAIRALRPEQADELLDLARRYE